MNRHLEVSQYVEIKNALNVQSRQDIELAINARAVHQWLGVKRDFSNWIKGRIKKYEFKEGVDFVITEEWSTPDLASSKSRKQKLIEYHCAPDMVKQLAMVENSEKGRLCRLYFIDLEKITKEEGDRLRFRENARMEYRPMSDAIKEDHEEPKPYHYSNEANMINRIVLGVTSKQYRLEHGLGHQDPIRDTLTTQEVGAISELQRMNTNLIHAGIQLKERKKILNNLFDNKLSSGLISEIEKLES